jgi:hypothetical protein
MDRTSIISVDRVRKLLNYSEDTGVFTWIPRGRKSSAAEGIAQNIRLQSGTRYSLAKSPAVTTGLDIASSELIRSYISPIA